MKYQCAHCGETYPIDHVRQWGKHEASNGHGPTPCCTALVQDHLGSGAVCRGPLVAQPLEDGEAVAPITLNR